MFNHSYLNILAIPHSLYWYFDSLYAGEKRCGVCEAGTLADGCGTTTQKSHNELCTPASTCAVPIAPKQTFILLALLAFAR